MIYLIGMLKTLLTHILIEHCLNVVFDRITQNFDLPATDWLTEGDLSGIFFYKSDDPDAPTLAHFNSKEQRLYSPDGSYIQYAYDDFDELNGLSTEEKIDTLTEILEDDLGEIGVEVDLKQF